MAVKMFTWKHSTNFKTGIDLSDNIGTNLAAKNSHLIMLECAWGESELLPNQNGANRQWKCHLNEFK